VEENQTSDQMPDRGKGGTIETVCSAMGWLSVIGGFVGAVMFGKVTQTMGILDYSYSSTKFSPALVIVWIGSGVVSAVFWYVLGGIGTALIWLESGRTLNHGASERTDQVALIPDGSQSATPLTGPDMATYPDLTKKTDTPEIEKTAEQIRMERRSSQNAKLFISVVFVALGVLFYLAVSK